MVEDRRIKVLIVDDSALIRKILTEILNTDRSIAVVGTAPDPYQARERIKTLRPDVITLDIEMPRMDGITFLRNLMRLYPLPVVMISSLTERGADATLEALELGAVDFVAKPKADVAHSFADYREEIITKVKTAARARIRNALDRTPPAQLPVRPVPDAPAEQGRPRRNSIIAIGASTGGTEAIKDVLVRLPADAPGIVISQHIPAAFSPAFAARMNRLSAMTVGEALDGQQILAGHAYIAPGDRHLLVERDGARYFCRLSQTAPVNRHRPSVDVMFHSVARQAGRRAIGVLLTGMGDDGARGLREMHDCGAPTIAQDEPTSVVWGMPGEAVRMGGVDRVLPIEAIAGHIVALAQRSPG